MFNFSGMLRRVERNRTLSDLLKLDDHLLRDIGLTRTDVFEMRRGRRNASMTRDHE
jgi:uncharacterized protein YjiS (DUF1127 family)